MMLKTLFAFVSLLWCDWRDYRQCWNVENATREGKFTFVGGENHFHRRVFPSAAAERNESKILRAQFNYSTASSPWRDKSHKNVIFERKLFQLSFLALVALLDPLPTHTRESAPTLSGRKTLCAEKNISHNFQLLLLMICKKASRCEWHGYSERASEKKTTGKKLNSTRRGERKKINSRHSRRVKKNEGGA